MTIKGTVIDAVTKKPIPYYNAIAGFDAMRSVRWNRQRVFSGSQGQFTMDFDENLPNFIRVSAVGYQPVVSRHLSNLEVEVALTFELNKGASITGTIAGEDDQLLQGVTTALVTESSEIILRGPGGLSSPGNLSRSDGQGRFTFLPDPEALAVIAAHEKGYAEATLADLARTNRLTLKPWGAVAVTPGTNPATATLAFMTADVFLPKLFNCPYLGALTLDFDNYSGTVAAGETSVFQVPPGKRLLWCAVCIDDNGNDQLSNLSFNGRTVTVKPGQTNAIMLGADGFSIRGRMPADGGDSWATRLGCLRYNTGAAGEAIETIFTFGAEGRFRVADLPLTATALQLTLFEPPVCLGSVTLPTTDRPGLVKGMVWNTGDLKFTPVMPATNGQAAPAFEMRTLAGKPIRLLDYRNKIVLLDFWTSWCGSSQGMLPHLKKVQSIYAKSDRFVMISVNVDRDPARARGYVARHQNTWLQGYAGSWLHTPLLGQYGVTCLPSACLIGADGRLLARDLAGPDIEAEVNRALGP